MFNHIKEIPNRIHRHLFAILILSIPLIVLFVLHLINPHLREEVIATYCPLPIEPTVLEQDIWIFPSPITEMNWYLTVFLVIYVVGFLARRLYRVHQEQKAQAIAESAQEKVLIGPSTLKILSPFLLAGLVLFAYAIVMGVIDSLSPSDYYFGSSGFLIGFLQAINGVVIPLLLLLGVIQFVWGAFLYVIPGIDGDRYVAKISLVLRV